jgi:hypothetical protein
MLYKSVLGGKMAKKEEYTGEYWQVPPPPTPEEKKKMRKMLDSGVVGRRRRQRKVLLELYRRELDKKGVN